MAATARHKPFIKLAEFLREARQPQAARRALTRAVIVDQCSFSPGGCPRRKIGSISAPVSGANDRGSCRRTESPHGTACGGWTTLKVTTSKVEARWQRMRQGSGDHWGGERYQRIERPLEVAPTRAGCCARMRFFSRRRTLTPIERGSAREAQPMIGAVRTGGRRRSRAMMQDCAVSASELKWIVSLYPSP